MERNPKESRTILSGRVLENYRLHSYLDFAKESGGIDGTSKWLKRLRRVRVGISPYQDYYKIHTISFRFSNDPHKNVNRYNK